MREHLTWTLAARIALLAIASTLAAPSAASAQSQSVAPTVTYVSVIPSAPTAGAQVTVTAHASGGKDFFGNDPARYVIDFLVFRTEDFDDPFREPVAQGQSTHSPSAFAVAYFTFSLQEGGDYTLWSQVTCNGNSNDCAGDGPRRDFTVAPPLDGTLAGASSARFGGVAQFTAQGLGGRQPYTYAWRYQGDPEGEFTRHAGQQTIQRLFPNGLSATLNLAGQPYGPDDLPATSDAANVNPPVPTATQVRITDAGGGSTVQTVSTDVRRPLFSPLAEILPIEGLRAGVRVVLEAAESRNAIGPYTYIWEVREPGQQYTEIGRGRTVTWTPSGAGEAEIRLSVRDAALPRANSTANRQIVTVLPAPDVVSPSSSSPVPEPPSSCASGTTLRTVTFALTQARGCFRSSGGKHTSTQHIVINSLPITPADGSPITLTEPTSGKPGGQISTSFAVVGVRLPNGTSITPIRRALELDLPALPAGATSGSARVASIGSATGVALFGFTIGGNAVVSFERTASNEYVSRLDLQLNLPAIFRSGPPSGSNPPGGISGEVRLRATPAGINFTGLRFEINNAYIGPIRLKSLCFALAAGGFGIDPCSPAAVGGTFSSPSNQLLSCGTTNLPATSDRWTATAAVVIPTPSNLEIGAYAGGVTAANGATRIEYLGGQGSNLGIAIAPGVVLDRIGGGICFDPLILSAQMGAGLLPDASGSHIVKVNGSITYAAGTPAIPARAAVPAQPATPTTPARPAQPAQPKVEAKPWRLTLRGDVNVRDNQVGTAEVKLAEGGDFDFDVRAAFRVGGILSIDGGIVGWVQPTRQRFNVEGNVTVAIDVLGVRGEASARAVASSTGIAGCITVGIEPFVISAGAGYLWGSRELRLMAPTCSVASYRAVRAARQAGGAATTFAVAAGQPGVAFRVQGTNAPPKILVTGPGDLRIESGSESITLVRDRYLILEDERDNSTHVLVVRPPAGRYTVASTVAGNPLTGGVQTAAVVEPFRGSGTVTRAGGRHRLRLRYTLPEGATLSLVERGPRVARVLAESVRGERCGEQLCSTTTFTPSPGPAGARRIEAVVERGGLPQAPVVVARYAAPRRPVVGAPSRVQLRRSGNTVAVRWRGPARVSSYNVVVETADGRMATFDVGRNCRVALMRRVARAVGLTARVQAVTPNGHGTRAASGSLRPHRKAGGLAGARLASGTCTSDREEVAATTG